MLGDFLKRASRDRGRRPFFADLRGDGKKQLCALATPNVSDHQPAHETTTLIRKEHYQWQLNGTDIAGATNPTLTLNNVRSDQGGTYQVQVSLGRLRRSIQSGLFLTTPTHRAN